MGGAPPPPLDFAAETLKSGLFLAHFGVEHQRPQGGVWGGFEPLPFEEVILREGLRRALQEGRGRRQPAIANPRSELDPEDPDRRQWPTAKMSMQGPALAFRLRRPAKPFAMMGHCQHPQHPVATWSRPSSVIIHHHRSSSFIIVHRSSSSLTIGEPTGVLVGELVYVGDHLGDRPGYWSGTQTHYPFPPAVVEIVIYRVRSWV